MTTIHARDIAEVRNNIERSLFSSQRALAPRKSREECFDAVLQVLRANERGSWVRPALDLTSHTLFRTETVSVTPRSGRPRTDTLNRLSNFRHWFDLCAILTEHYGDGAEELKLLLITGSFTEMELLVSGEVDDLIGPYRATQDLEEWLRHSDADRPRGCDMDALKRLEKQYNNIPGTPLHQLVELGLSRVINLNSTDDIRNEYKRVFVTRVRESVGARPMIPIFALSYKHEGHELRMTENNFLEVCARIKSSGFERVQLWIDALLQESADPWARRGLLPYTVLPVVVHNNELYDDHRERIWLKLERVAASGRGGVLFTRPTSHDEVRDTRFVSGESRNLVAACILCKDYNPESVTFKEDEDDLQEWATEHVTVATFRSFLGISRVGKGQVASGAKQECIQSAILKYNETMPHRQVQLSHSGGPCSVGDSSGGWKGRARNERLTTHVCMFMGTTYVVRAGRGFGITMSKVDAVEAAGGVARVERLSAVSAEERRQVLKALTSTLIVLGEEAGDTVRMGVAKRWTSLGFIFGGTTREHRKGRVLGLEERVVIDKWGRWPEFFPALDRSHVVP